MKLRPWNTLACILVLLPLLPITGRSQTGTELELFNPDWSMALDDFGYSDWAYDRRPGFELREYLSGEWAAAIAFTQNAVRVGPTWLNPNFYYPDWLSGSDFYAEAPIEELPAKNQYGFSVARSRITNGSLRIGITSDMVDTTNGVPQGLAPRSSAARGSVLSDRYVLRQAFAITNTSGQTLTSVRFYKFLHSLQATRALYDDRTYGPTFNGHHYTLTEQGTDFGENFISYVPAVHSDTVTLHANRAPSGWEVGRFGIEGIDDHANNKPSVGVHQSVESGVLSGLDSFGPTNHWVSGALQFELGTLAPNAWTNIEFLMSLGTVTAMKAFKVVAWGDNTSHQADVPLSATNITAIAAGARHSVGLRSDGRVIAWGDNRFGQTNVQAGLSNVIEIAAGANHTLALRSDGKVFAWGDNASGQSAVPGTLTRVEHIAAGANHSLALQEDGTIVGWGNNSFGQLNAPALLNVQALAAGSNFSLALQYDGTIAAWGDNSRGQLDIPASLAYPNAIAAGESHALALDWDGAVVGWGDNSQGQLNVPFGLDVSSITAGGNHSLALEYSGRVVAWGANSQGQTNVPAALIEAAAVAAGGAHNLALAAVLPRLDLLRTNQNVQVSWSAAWAPEVENVVLEQATSLRGASWTPVTMPGWIDQGRYLVTVPLESGARFYRLRIYP